MTQDNAIGTEAPSKENASPDNVSKVDKMTEAFKAMKEEIIQPKSSKETDLPEKGGTQDQEEKTQNADLSEKKQADGTQQNEKSEWEKRYNNLQSRADKEASKAEQLARKLIEKDPNYIHDLAKEDKELADKIVKSELSSKGINSYEEFSKAIERESLPEAERNIQERLDALERERAAEQKARVESFIADFREKNPSFKDEIEQKTFEMYEKGGISFQEAFDYVNWKYNRQNVEAEMANKVTKEVLKKDIASGIQGGTSKVSGTPTKPSINTATRNILEGIGARKTLNKYN